MEIQHIKSNWLIIYYAHQPNTINATLNLCSG